MPESAPIQPSRLVFLFLGAAVIYGVIFVAGVQGEEKGKQYLARAESMFVVVQPFPNAELIRHNTFRKGSMGDVSNSYRTTAGFREIRSYYDGELAKNGWRFVSEEPVLEWGKDTGQRVAYYRHGDFRANLYSNENGFILYFSW